MFMKAALLSILGLSALATALPNPSPGSVEPAAALVCEFPTGDCSLVGNCQYCCIGDPVDQEFWVPSLGRFGPHCVGVIGHIPLWSSLLILVLHYGFHPLWKRRPPWLRKFVVEDDPSSHAGEISTPKEKSLTQWAILLLVLATSGIILAVVGITLTRVPLHQVSIVPNILSCIILLVDRPQSLPGAVLLLQLILLFTDIAILAASTSLPGPWYHNSWAIGICFPLACILVMLNIPMRDAWKRTDGISKPFAEPTSTLRSPEDNMTLWQWMSVSWMAPLISVGVERQLHGNDVWLLPYEFQHSRLHTIFRELNGSVLIRLLKANGLDLVIISCLGFLETFAELAEPVLLKQLLAALAGGPKMMRVTFVYAGLSLLAKLVRAQSGIFSMWFGRRAYERSRGEMITMIYEKTLRRKDFVFPSNFGPDSTFDAPEPGTSTSTTLTDDEDDDPDDVSRNNSLLPTRFKWFGCCFRSRGYDKRSAKSTAEIPASGPASTGKILNLMRNDVYEVAQRFWEFASLVTKPLAFILSIVLIWRLLGPASLSGMLVLLIGQILNVFILRAFVNVQKVRRGITDAKLQLTSQFVEAIRHLRWYAWQNAWLVRIFETRAAELSKTVLGNVLIIVYSFVNNLTGYLFPFFGFMAYTLISQQPLTVEIGFPALDLFTTLQNNLRELPNLVTVLLNAKVAMNRIEDFMAEPEKDAADQVATGPLGKLEIELKGATFSWPGSEKRVLRNVSILCKPGLSLVCGKVGIGKTALLHAILGELDQLGGERRVPTETVGYCAQSPWLQNMSIRENILFCAEYDEARYLQVLDACCLLPDLANFKAGDLSFIGENGVGLSGGQKARVALARAIYSRSRILLLDDPIAALDHQTAETILRTLFARSSPLMHGRLVIFVTHRIHLVTNYADQVLDVVEGGRVNTIGREELESNEELRALAAAATSELDEVNEEPVALDESAAVPDKFIEEEYRPHGGVMASVYWQYVKAGKLRWWSLLVVSLIAFRIINVLYFWYLKEWVERSGESDRTMLSPSFSASIKQHSFSSHEPTIHSATVAALGNDWLDFGKYLPSPQLNVRPWLFWFLVISVAQVIARLLSEFLLLAIMYEAAKQLFQDAVRRVSGATFRFYDVTPVGRLMNRLTSDMGAIDGQIAGQIQQFAWFMISWLSAVFVIATATPLFLVVIAITTCLFVVIFSRFLPASQSLRRLETVSLSPLMSNFGTLLEGLTTVRAFQANSQFQQRLVATTDAFQQMDHFYWSLQGWLQFRFDALSAFSTFALTATAALSGLSGGLTGFILASASTFVSSTHALCRRYGELQMQFVSVERVVELLSLEQEDCGRKCISPPAAWPTFSDDVVFDNVTLRYAPNLDPSLLNASFHIPAGSSVSVTGRTGSGKSTLALSLLGTLHPDAEDGGKIYIGGVDLATVDKEALRRRVTFVAQDPVLFPGTLRDNLDPVKEHTDEECAGVLERVLGSVGDFNLDSRVDGGGKNLSQGQRQLVGLGRAILRRSALVILDEATASIDHATADCMHDVLRQELRHSTVITIAHRVEAVRDANYCIVLDKGRVGSTV
ncbi:related to bile acid transporter [Cephalotrichum gorgonifer]|uniref:Related to bile acid transporter n=1 Tax=Cephalotrichum gorgonifer TaxID=2041049 RepID=A0AAE8N4G5_9PEZI|nr:related to bile acid transporter [Cephalotrichum gorgonifer]